MNDQEKQEIMQIANDIQAGELSRQRGSLNVEVVNRLFGWDIISKIGQQRIDAALYLHNAGYRKIPKGAVVVTADDITRDKTFDQTFVRRYALETLLHEERKNATETVLQRLWSVLVKDGEQFVAGEIKSLAEAYNVEVEE